MAEALEQADGRMSDVEALMWSLENDPHLASWFANVTVLDRPIDVDRFKRRMAKAVAALPRLRQRVVPALGRLAPPSWRDDPEFDIDFHVRSVALPAPGTERQLFELATELAQTPFDRTRPLWEFTVVDGLQDGRGGLIQKLHHTITDGEGAVRLSMEFLDLSRDQAEPDDVPAIQPNAAALDVLSTTVDALTHNLRRQLGVGRRTLGEAADLIRHPSRVPVLAEEAVATARSVFRQLAVTDPARSPLWHERSLQRQFEVLRIPLDDVKRAAKAMDGSVNDVFVAGAVFAAAEYHRSEGIELDELRITMPVSTRRGGPKGGNSFAPTRVLLPVAPGAPGERFAAVRDKLGTARTERAIGLVGAMAGIVNVLPTSMLTRIARQQVETVDFATSNVRGGPFELYMAGALIEANYPMGPTAGTAFNLTTLSYNGSLDMGLNIDTTAVAQPEKLRDCLALAYEELLAAGT